MLEKIFNGLVIATSALIALGIGTILLYSGNDFVKNTMDTGVNKIVAKMEAASKEEDAQNEGMEVSPEEGKDLDYEELNTENVEDLSHDTETYDYEKTKEDILEDKETVYQEIEKQEEEEEVEKKLENNYFGGDYSYSTERYFDIQKNREYGLDEEQLDLMQRFNMAADAVEEQGGVQEDIDFGILSGVDVEYYDENTYINPYEESPLRRCYAIKGMRLPYYVDLEWGHVANGTNEWEVVLNYFMEGLLNYLSVKEAKKFVDVDSAYLMAEPGEDVYRHIKQTDKCIAAILLQATSAVTTTQNSNGRYVAQGSYYLDNVVQMLYNGTEIARATVDVMYIRTEAIEVPPEKVVELDPSRTYISTYMDDPATGKKYCFNYKFATRQFEVSMVRDDNNDWKIVCIEP